MIDVWRTRQALLALSCLAVATPLCASTAGRIGGQSPSAPNPYTYYVYVAAESQDEVSLLRFDGQAITVLPGQTTCYRCVFHAAPPASAVPSCSQAGVLGVLAGVMGTIQATEAMKFLLEIGDLLTDRLLIYDSLAMKFREVKLKRNSNCRLCGDSPSITELNDAEPVVCDMKA